MATFIKYPRTPHLPWSPGGTGDDAYLIDTSHFDGREVVVTEKLDGENTSMFRDKIHARSPDSRHHPSRDWVKALHGRVAPEIPAGWRLCGENVFARHSLEYRNLDSYFYVFSVWTDEDEALGWDETLEWAQLLGLEIVPELYRGPWEENAVRELTVEKEPEAAGLGEDERCALVLGAALHDLGKTLSTREEDRGGRKRIVPPYHTERGRSYLAPRMPLLGLPWEICDTVLALVGHHHAPGKLVARAEPERRYRRLVRAADPKLLYLLELADLRGRDQEGGDGEGRGFDALELFRLGAEDAGVWTGGDPYREWRDRIEEKLPGADPGMIDYVVGVAIGDYEAGLIHTPDEAIARTYEWRENHPEVIVTCGPSGSGKSTWIETNCCESEKISLDEIREELTGRRDNQSKNGEVMQLAKSRFRQHLRDRKRIVWDATALRTDGRSMVLQLAHEYHARTRIVAFACPPDRVISRNRDRKHALSRKVLDRQFDRLQWPEVWEAHGVDVVVEEKRG